MFCPECQMEFEDSTTDCPNCGMPLVAYSENDPDPETDDVLRERVPVLVTTNRTVALMARSFLEEAGIDYLAIGDLPNGLPSTGPNGAIPGNGPVEFQVLPQDALEAKEILGDLADEGDVEEEEVEDES